VKFHDTHIAERFDRKNKWASVASNFNAKCCVDKNKKINAIAVRRQFERLHEAWVQLQVLRTQKLVVKKRLEKYNSTDISRTAYEVGNFVFVVPIQRRSKLYMPLQGPYKIVFKNHDNLYHLQSLFNPTDILSVHPERIRLMMNDDTPEEELSKLGRYDNKEYVVDQIINHKGDNKKNLRFLVRWEGYGEESDTWEPHKNLDGCDKLDTYLKNHVAVADILSKPASKKNLKRGSL